MLRSTCVLLLNNPENREPASEVFETLIELVRRRLHEATAELDKANKATVKELPEVMEAR